MPVSTISMQEWENGNEQRRYPFADDSLLTAESGFRLSDFYFVDGMLHPFDLEGELYLSGIDLTTGKVVLSDSATGLEKGSAPITGGTLIFTDSLNRHVGKLIIGRNGTALSSLVGAHTFSPTATRFAPAAVFPQNQTAVRAVRTPDGALLTGDVTIVGENGVRVTVETVGPGGEQAIFVNAVGVATRPPGSRLGDPIRHIYISQPGNSVLSLSRDGNVIYLGHCFQLEELCGSKDYLARPGGKLPPHADTPFGHDRDEDPCELPPEPPVTPPCPDPLDPGVQEVEHCGFMYLVSTSDVLSICNTSIPSAGAGLQGSGNSLVPDTGAGGSCTDAAGRGADLVIRQLPPRDLQGLQIKSRV